MPGFGRSVTIDRPPSQVYAVLDDLHAAPNWVPAIRRIEVLTPDFAVDVGFRWRETRRVMGIFRVAAELEIIEHQPRTRWGAKFEDKKLRATTTFELSRDAAGTLVTMREEVTDLQGKPKRAERMATWMEKADDDLLVRLKAYVESMPAKPDLDAPAKDAPVQAAKKADKRATSSTKKPKAAKKAR